MKNKGYLMRMVLVSIVIAVAATFVYAQSTAFTYQGRLTDGGVAANGLYDLEFRLLDAAAAGNQIGASLQLTGVQVTSGGFGVELDFGDVFPGSARYLEIRVSPPGQGNYTTLSPRQRIGTSPYAVKSLSADSATTAGNTAQLGGLAASQYTQTTDARLSDARTPLAGSNNYVQNTTSQQSGANFNVGGDGTVGGTLTANNIRLGSTGQYHTPAGEESLRIIRGIVGGISVQIEAGTGFTASAVPFDDKITILYNTPFPSAPTVVVTARGSVRAFATLREPTAAVPATHGFMVSIFLDTGTPTNTTTFNFVVIGPR